MPMNFATAQDRGAAGIFLYWRLRQFRLRFCEAPQDSSIHDLACLLTIWLRSQFLNSALWTFGAREFFVLETVMHIVGF